MRNWRCAIAAHLIGQGASAAAGAADAVGRLLAG